MKAQIARDREERSKQFKQEKEERTVQLDAAKAERVAAKTEETK